ncbi:uncharacterized protein LOC125668617 isoform X1 [Ostrea edulis]|uniref:uncharacterized protein LOC125668617 isoform X1 n=1 Tax=Ostrea edulis TaxID=37623 RepID=UPI0024AEB9E3|nr:uncharacterized protein LOC125668617 isoform X1 [Ostrea edulis]
MAVDILVLLLGSWTVTVASFCDNVAAPTASSQSAPKLPQLPSTFQTRIELNLIDKNTTVDLVEYYDYDGNRVRIDTLKNSIEGSNIYSFDTNEIFYVTNGFCRVGSINSSMGLALFGEMRDDGTMHVRDSSFAFKFGSSYSEVYIGQDSVRGIVVDHWKSCMKWAQSNRTYTVDYYFSAEGVWNTSSGFVSVPVRAEVTGPGYSGPMHHVYDYYSFSPSLPDDITTVFETPVGVICPGRQSTRGLPPIPAQFYYRMEVVNPVIDLVTTVDVWYDEKYKLVRTDYRPLSPGPPTYNINPLTEVQDFNAGVRYIKDNVYGNCSVLSLPKTAFGASENMSAFKTNGSYVLHMKNPLQLFSIDSNFTFVGQRPCRQLTCDVFSAKRPYYVEEMGTANATIEFYFLSNNDHNYPNDGNAATRDVPIQITIDMDKVGFRQVMNIMDFDGNHPDLSNFDVSSCYSQTAKVHFKIRFPGVLQPALTDSFIYNARQQLDKIMYVSPLRVQDVRVEYDMADVYLLATLLDRTSPTAQFTYTQGQRSEFVDDIMFKNIIDPSMCAKLCVEFGNFTCNSFDLCPGNSQGSCRLSRRHISEGSSHLVQGGGCDHFSRTVNGLSVTEKTIYDAYASLRKAILSKQYLVQTIIDSVPLRTYVGVDLTITYGWIQPTAVPVIKDFFSYSQEIVIPQYGQVFVSKVWYSQDYKLVRYDFHNTKPTGPFYSTNPMTTIHDYNTGIQYALDRFYENCTMSAIQPGAFDSTLDFSELITRGSYVVKLKSPMDVFHLTPQMRFIGQRTVRDFLTNVYEAVLKNYTMPGLNGRFTAIVEYYFITNGWVESASSDAGDTKQYLVKTDMIIIEKALVITTNYYDFEYFEPDLSLFDVRKCFTATDQHQFRLTFPGQYHPYLDIYEKVFQLETLEQMSRASGASILRFQELSINYDPFNIYVSATILGRTPYLTEFTKFPTPVKNLGSDALFANLKSADECANACLSINRFPCNSFDYCSETNKCYLSRQHVSTGNAPSVNNSCQHYSKTVNASSVPAPTLVVAYSNLKNAVYGGQLRVVISANNHTTLYKAASIKDILSSSSDGGQGGPMMKHFTEYKQNSIMVKSDFSLNGIAVDDCATECLTEELFDCQSFVYCTGQKLCLLSKVHPDLNQTFVQPHKFCDLYTRQYLDHYNAKPGTTFPTNADNVIMAVPTPNLCAKECTVTGSCKSFDYCSDSKTCRLKNTHELDAPNAVFEKTPNCNHYSRKYIDDFKFVEGKQMNFGKVLEFDGVSVDQCAKLCVEEEDVHCRTFAYCDKYKQCKLMTQTPRQVGPGYISSSGLCNLYIRVYNPSSSLPSNTSKVIYRNLSPQSSHSDLGLLLGTSFGVFIFGLVLGGGAVYFFRKYKRKDDEITMDILANESD